jgi:hypothetical protein
MMLMPTCLRWCSAPILQLMRSKNLAVLSFRMAMTMNLSVSSFYAHRLEGFGNLARKTFRSTRHHPVDKTS